MDQIPQIDQVKRYLRERSDIAFAYLFGSLARGKAIHLSDIDIAVYVLGEYAAHKRLEILGDLIDLLKNDSVDLVILNKAALSLKMKVIQERRILADNRPFLRHRFESSVVRSYIDFSRIENRILEGRYLHG